MLNVEHKRRSRCFPACFSSMSTHPFDFLDNEDHHYDNNHNNNRRARTPPPMGSPLPEIKGRCLNLISKIGGGRVRRRHASADFSYDPASYALNFEDDTGRADDNLLLGGGGVSARLSTSSSIPTTPHEKINRTHLDDILEEEAECVSRMAMTNAAAEVNKGKSRTNGCVPRRRGRKHSSSSMDFSYEPSSYARNFEDDMSREDEFISLRKFGGLLAAPRSPKATSTPPPPHAKCSSLRPEIAAFS